MVPIIKIIDNAAKISYVNINHIITIEFADEAGDTANPWEEQNIIVRLSNREHIVFSGVMQDFIKQIKKAMYI